MKTLKIAAFSALLACGTAFAQQEPPMQQPADEYPAQPPAQTPPSTTESPQATGSQLPEFSTVDKNGDGQVSRDEAAAAPVLSQVWTDADADQNGSLSNSEYERVRQAIENQGEQR